MSRILALDLSLTATGYCVSDKDMVIPKQDGMRWGVIETKGMTGMARIQHVVNRIASHLPADLVVMEDLAYGQNMPGTAERVMLAGVLRYVLYLRKQKYVLVSPTSLKKFVVGSGKAEKSAIMLEVFKRFGVSCTNDNEADAVGLAFIGRALLGEWQPTMDAQREVMAKIKI